jgi:hypothetical protein
MEYISSNANIQIPRVYFYKFDATNEVGGQFMLMERLPGKPLYEF